jgi:hypothetical protein
VSIDRYRQLWRLLEPGKVPGLVVDLDLPLRRARGLAVVDIEREMCLEVSLDLERAREEGILVALVPIVPRKGKPALLA